MRYETGKSFGFYKKMVLSSLDHAQCAMDKSKNHYRPSPEVSKIGAKIGICVGIGILIGGIIQMVMDKPIYAVISVLLACCTIFSNTMYLKKWNR